MKSFWQISLMTNILYAIQIMTSQLKISSHLHVFINRSVLCNCGIGADNHYILESFAACNTKISKSIMHFTMNTAFTNYLEMFPNLTDSLQTPLIRNRTTFEQTLSITLKCLPI